MNIEYLRYKNVRSVYDLMCNELDHYSSCEMVNILERWMINLSNHFTKDDDDIIFSYEKLSISYPDTAKMLSEIADKKLSTSKVPQMLSLLNTYIEQYNKNMPDNLQIFLTVNSITINDSRFDIGAKTLFKLLNKNNNTYDLAKLLLRYECILPGGQQWSIPSVIYSFFTKTYDVSIEAFASPFNNNLDKYCSLFPDTDKSYGSIGNFFKTNFNNCSVLVNPPFVPNILEQTVDKIITTCDSCTGKEFVRFFIFVPNWKDAEFYTKLNNSKYKSFDLVLNKNKHHYIDYKLGKNIIARFDSHIFVLSVNHDTNYNQLSEQLFDLYKIK